MKKSSFIAVVMGTVSFMLFALGMCMAMLPEWNAFEPGIVFGCLGGLLGLITVFVWRKLEHKAPIKISGKAVAAVLFGVVGAVILGVGMCFVMVWENMIPGILIGIVGIILLLCLIPLCKGLKQ